MNVLYYLLVLINKNNIFIEFINNEFKCINTMDTTYKTHFGIDSK